MRFNSGTSSAGVREHLFALDEIPGVLWTPEGAVGTRPLIVMGHDGGRPSRTVCRGHVAGRLCSGRRVAG
ncbi:hypothetical protein GCM10027075_25900 [Streptomyces heilongjiangensis]